MTTDVSSKHPQIEQLLGEASSLFEANQLPAAEAACRRALALQPDHMDALGAMGLILHALKRFGEAESVFAELIRRNPDEPLYWMNLGTARRGEHRYDDALTAYIKAAQLGCASADFFYNVGLTHLDRHDLESARTVLKRATELAPQDAAIRYEYAKACYQSLHTTEAVAALEDWENLQSLDPELVANIAQTLMNLGESERAEQALRRFSPAENLAPRVSLTLAQMLERTNRLNEARRALDSVSENPRAEAMLGGELASLQGLLAQRESRHEEACKRFRRSLAERPELHSRHFDLFPLAKSLDALGHYDEAFDVLVEAHESQRAYIELTSPLSAVRGTPTMTITQYNTESSDVATWDESSAPATSESPIFIVAFPRSGTTLLELTLDAHPMLASMDEQPFLQNALDDIIALGVRYPEQLGQLTAAQLATVRAKYWERVRRKVQLREGQRLVDKNPLNMLRLPVIRRLFPNARVIMAIRHPCDVILSCYMQQFRAPDFALLCNDLQSLAAGFRRSFDFWYREAERLQPSLLEIRYESFVADFEAQVRMLSGFLEVPWSDAMLAPAQRAAEKGFISTPSYSQVVQPVNKKSVGRWRAYEHQLAPVMAELRPYLQRWGYAG